MNEDVSKIMKSKAFKKLEAKHKAATHDWVGLCKCGAWRCVCVEVPGDEKDTARFVSDGIKKGYEMKRVTHEDWKKMSTDCTCPKLGQQEMFGG